MDFAALKTETESWLLDLPAGAVARVPGWINEAIRDACRRHNFRFMEAEADFTTTPDTRELGAKPERWKETRGAPYYVRQDGSTVKINWAASEADMLRSFAIDMPAEGNEAPPDRGSPRYVLQRPDTFDIFPLPDDKADWDDDNYRLTIPFWQYPAALAADADENFITGEAPFYVVFKALSYGFAWNRDEERAQHYAGRAEREYKRIERTDKLSRLPDRMSLSVSKDVYARRPRSGLRG